VLELISRGYAFGFSLSPEQIHNEVFVEYSTADHAGDLFRANRRAAKGELPIGDDGNVLGAASTTIHSVTLTKIPCEGGMKLM
jgi:hypothetical protein